MSLKFLTLIFLLFVVGPDCSAGADDYYYYYYYGDGGGGGGGSGGSSVTEVRPETEPYVPHVDVESLSDQQATLYANLQQDNLDGLSNHAASHLAKDVPVSDGYPSMNSVTNNGDIYWSTVPSFTTDPVTTFGQMFSTVVTSSTTYADVDENSYTTSTVAPGNFLTATSQNSTVLDLIQSTTGYFTSSSTTSSLHTTPYPYYSAYKPKEQDPEEIEYAVVFGITAPLILVVVYMAIVGVRNGDPRRWHSINVLLWMLWQTVLYADVAQKSPWRGFIKNDDVQIMNIYMQIHNISVITGGNILLLIETITSSIMYICKPKARRSYTYSIVWFIIMIPVYNAIQVTLFVCKYALPNQKWWYDPVEAFHVITCLLHGLLLVIFLLFAIVMTVLIPICGGKRKDPSSESALFPILRLWLTWIYCLITAMLIIPFQSMNVASFVLTKFSAQIADFMSGFDMSGAGGFDGMADLMQMAATYLGLNDFLVLCVPLTVAILTLVCFPCFWTPLINMLTCGRLLPIKSKKSIEMKAWATNSSIFPSGEPSMEKKVPPP